MIFRLVIHGIESASPDKYELKFLRISVWFDFVAFFLSIGYIIMYFTLKKDLRNDKIACRPHYNLLKLLWRQTKKSCYWEAKPNRERTTFIHTTHFWQILKGHQDTSSCYMVVCSVLPLTWMNIYLVFYSQWDKDTNCTEWQTTLRDTSSMMKTATAYMTLQILAAVFFFYPYLSLVPFNLPPNHQHNKLQEQKTPHSQHYFPVDAFDVSTLQRAVYRSYLKLLSPFASYYILHFDLFFPPFPLHTTTLYLYLHS